VDTIKAVWKLSLLELETHLRDFKKKVVADVLATTFSKRKVSEYIGYIDKKIKVQYGIDLKNIRVRNEGSKIVVSGIKCEYQGTLERNIVDKHREVREQSVNNDENSSIYSVSVLQGDKNSLLLNAYEEHADEVNAKVNSGVDLVGLEGASTFVENLGKEFVRNFLLRSAIEAGRTIEFVNENMPNGLTLEEYAQKCNAWIESERKQRNEKIKMLGG